MSVLKLYFFSLIKLNLMFTVINKNNFKTLLIATSFPWIVLIISPLTMFFGNRNEYGEVIPILIGLFGGFFLASLVLFFLIKAIQNKVFLYRSLCGIITGLALAAWIQSQLLVWNFGPLDGRGLEWAKFEKHSILEIIVWILVVIIVVAAFLRQHKLASMLPKGVWVLGLVSVGMSFISLASHDPNLVAGTYETPEESFAFHKHNNSLIIVLDSYQSDAFLEIFNNYPTEVAFLEGFTYYPDTVGGYPTTRHAIPLILTGKFYKNDFVYSENNQANFERESLATYYFSKKYGVTGDFGKPILRFTGKEAAFPPGLRDFKFLGLAGSQIRAIDIGLFRASPIIVKKTIYDEGRWFFLKLRKDESAPPQPHGSDWRFVNEFVSSANISSKNLGEFKFVHLIGAHSPLSVDENFTPTEGLADTRENYVNQARGVLKLTSKMLNKLKELSIYEDAEILIIADHGSHNKIPIDLQGDKSALQLPILHLGAARPLFLYKASGAMGKLKVVNEPMHLSYIPCLLSNMKKFDCRDFAASVSGETVKRPHYRYEWAHDFWFKDYSPPMTLYEVKGDVRKFESWTNTMTVYEDGIVRKLDRFYLLGDTINFGEGGTSQKYLINGWSHREAAHQWTDGPEATLRLNISDASNKNLALELYASGFSPDGVNPQSVTVSVNGAAVANWKVLNFDRFQAMLPASAMTSDELFITFSMEKPTSPCIVGQSSDCRKLGLAVNSLIINAK